MFRKALYAFIILGTIMVPLAALADDDDDYDDDDDEEYWEEGPQVDTGTPGAAVNFETFRQGLSPYGDWIQVGNYGHVWRPRVGQGWKPYYYGRWVWSDEGWLWVSDEPWGWGPYHYGRWANDPYNGWIWVPGYQWAPAWVSWRFGGAAVGWAPLTPGVSIYVSSYPVVYSAWTFVPNAQFVGSPIHRVAYAHSHVPSMFRGTMPAPPRAIHEGRRAPAWGGPARGFVEQRVGHAIPPTRIVPVASPSQIGSGNRGGAIPVFRPDGHRPAPPPGAHSPGWHDRDNGSAPPPGHGMRPGDHRQGTSSPLPPGRAPSRSNAPQSPRAPDAPGRMIPGGGNQPPPSMERGGGYQAPPSHAVPGGNRAPPSPGGGHGRDPSYNAPASQGAPVSPGRPVSPPSGGNQPPPSHMAPGGGNHVPSSPGGGFVPPPGGGHGGRSAPPPPPRH